MAATTEVEPTTTMDTDDIRELKGKLHVTFLNPHNSSTNGSLGLTTFADVNFSAMTLGELIDLVVTDSKSPSSDKDGVDILHKAQVITGQSTSTLERLKLKPNSIVQVIKRFSKKSTETKTGKGAESMDTKDKTFTPEQLHQVSLALRTGFMQPSFAKTIKRLSESEMLDSIIAIAPQLATDGIGLAIIQSPGMIYYYSDLEPMKKLAEERPWVIDAFNFIAAAVHQDKSSSTPTGLPRGLISALLEAEGEGDDEMEEQPAAQSGSNTPRPQSASAPRPVRSQPNLFTREHVEQAIRGAFPFSMPPPPPSAIVTNAGPSGSGGAGSLSELLRSFQQAPTQLAPSPSASALPAQAPQENAAPAGGSISTTDFARAIMDAVNHLPESLRAEQLNMLRDRIQQISSAPVQSQLPGTTSTPPPATATTPTSGSGAGAQSTEFRAQLNQMREIGITNERLALQALRVSDGDVNTACDLIWSGWNGEGADQEPN